MRRRDFIAGLGSAAVWPVVARAQQPAMPVVAVVHGGTPEGAERSAIPFRIGLGEQGFVDGRNVAIEYHRLEGQYERLPPLIADLVRRRVTVIATPGGAPIP
jgi:putative ABC transport system substrate-binding protein